jgi:hypothetical protein
MSIRALRLGTPLAALFVAAAVLMTGDLRSEPLMYPADDDICRETSEWIRLNADRLPTNLQQLNELPIHLRRAAFSASSTETKVRFWLDHIQEELTDSRETLSNEQLDIIRMVVDRLPSIIGFQLDEAEVDRIQTTAYEILGPQVANQFFGNLGEASFQYKQCNCNIGSVFRCYDPTGPAQTCEESHCDSMRGCGFLWMFSCNGYCETTEIAPRF